MGLLSGNNIPGKQNDPSWSDLREQRTEPGRDFCAVETNDECMAGSAAIRVSLLDFGHAAAKIRSNPNVNRFASSVPTKDSRLPRASVDSNLVRASALKLAAKER